MIRSRDSNNQFGGGLDPQIVSRYCTEGERERERLRMHFFLHIKTTWIDGTY
jgi:hypothetical protein